MRRMILLVTVIALCTAVDGYAQGTWTHESSSDPIHNQQFDVYTLTGNYLSAPRHSMAEKPTLQIFCEKGKIWSASLMPGAFVDAHWQNAGFLSGWVTDIEFRADGAARAGGLYGLNISEDRRSVMMNSAGVVKLLAAPKTVISIREILGGAVLMQFEFPSLIPLTEGCGRDGQLRKLIRQ